MPLIAISELPSFARLRQQGETILPIYRAQTQEIRALHIGLLNMMPDSALEITERQFLRLIGQSNDIVQFHPHLLTIPGIKRSENTQKHIDQFYQSFENIKQQGLDVLIISGANVTNENLDEEPFWHPLTEIIDWAYEYVTSTLCSCLATHVVMQYHYNQPRQHLGHKCWGVFNHHVVQKDHPLTRDINTKFDVPHSRFNQVSKEQFTQAGLEVLVESAHAGVHVAVSKDGFRQVLFQGHPEYDAVSLLKEYKREVQRYFQRQTTDYPPFPVRYLNPLAQAILEEYCDEIKHCQNNNQAMPIFPESLVAPLLNNTWQDTTKSIFSNWIGLAYQLTHVERNKPFMDDIDPLNPLGR